VFVALTLLACRSSRTLQLVLEDVSRDVEEAGDARREPPPDLHA
jgi:hypothetical protein